MIKVIIMLIKIRNDIYFNLLLYVDMEQFYYSSMTKYDYSKIRNMEYESIC